MSVLLEATVDRKAISWAREVQSLKERTRALQRQHPNQKLVTGHREEGSKIHIVVMLAKAGKQRANASGNHVVAAPKFF